MRKYFCTFPQDLIQEPIISHTLGAEFDVVPNIRAAIINEQRAMVAVDIEGEPAEIDKAVAYLRQRGVEVEELREGENPPVFG
ncbi:NIL domain-containing protein [Engelhardtia mirabilis]|uniref:NIL domain protein n=1 Tax=Engelhardtia mirabilis TaxID=2528011 RepID=A0A518BLW4_9BACT|nr:NIL domain protein [Planctomycetes bacterium Pla133]QDV02262.1 NIL domain protein [Planctomycetes bacterium Pla86]